MAHMPVPKDWHSNGEVRLISGHPNTFGRSVALKLELYMIYLYLYIAS